MSRINTFLVLDKFRIVSIGLGGILKDNFNCFIIDTVNYLNIEKILKDFTVKIVFLEINIKGEIDKDLIFNIRKIQPSIEIILFTDSEDYDMIKFLCKTERVYFLKKTASEFEIVTKVSKILKKNPKVKKKNKYFLSEREKQIATLLIRGKRIIDIAKQLNLSPTTIATYKSRLFNKLKINNLLDLEKVYNFK